MYLLSNNLSLEQRFYFWSIWWVIIGISAEQKHLNWLREKYSRRRIIGSSCSYGDLRQRILVILCYEFTFYHYLRASQRKPIIESSNETNPELSFKWSVDPHSSSIVLSNRCTRKSKAIWIQIKTIERTLVVRVAFVIDSSFLNIVSKDNPDTTIMDMTFLVEIYVGNLASLSSDICHEISKIFCSLPSNFNWDFVAHKVLQSSSWSCFFCIIEKQMFK